MRASSPPRGCPCSPSPSVPTTCVRLFAQLPPVLGATAGGCAFATWRCASSGSCCGAGGGSRSARGRVVDLFRSRTVGTQEAPLKLLRFLANSLELTLQRSVLVGKVHQLEHGCALPFLQGARHGPVAERVKGSKGRDTKQPTPRAGKNIPGLPRNNYRHTRAARALRDGKAPFPLEYVSGI